MDNLNNTNHEFDIGLSGFFDPMTQIANRKKFDSMLAQEIEKAKNTISYLSLLMVEIDNFEKYYATYGHQAGDHCLRQIALTLKSSFKRSGDLAARWGDSKFICLLTDTDFAGAEKLAEKIRKSIIELNIPHIEPPATGVVTVSIGGVTSILTDDTSCNDLLEKVDQALLRAKEMGLNQVFVNEK